MAGEGFDSELGNKISPDTQNISTLFLLPFFHFTLNHDISNTERNMFLSLTLLSLSLKLFQRIYDKL